MKKKKKKNLNLPSDVVDESTGEAKFIHKLLLTDTQISRLCEPFAKKLPAIIKLSKTQLSKMI